MLILSRNTGDSIRISDDIKLTILENNGVQVRIGINAPKSAEPVIDRLRYAISQGIHKVRCTSSEPFGQLAA